MKLKIKCLLGFLFVFFSVCSIASEEPNQPDPIHDYKVCSIVIDRNEQDKSMCMLQVGVPKTYKPLHPELEKTHDWETFDFILNNETEDSYTEMLTLYQKRNVDFTAYQLSDSLISQLKKNYCRVFNRMDRVDTKFMPFPRQVEYLNPEDRAKAEKRGEYPKTIADNKYPITQHVFEYEVDGCIEVVAMMYISSPGTCCGYQFTQKVKDKSLVLYALSRAINFFESNSGVYEIFENFQ